MWARSSLIHAELPLNGAYWLSPCFCSILVNEGYEKVALVSEIENEIGRRKRWQGVSVT